MIVVSREMTPRFVSLPRAGGHLHNRCGVHTVVQMVEPDAGVVESRLVAGGLVCVGCGGELRPWGHARWRTLRDHGRTLRLRPRRSRCRACRVTHVLLPTVMLLRRTDLVVVIGEALRVRHAQRRSRAVVAAGAGVHPDTARRWLRRFAVRAEEIRVAFTSLAHRLDPELGPIESRASPGADALEAIGVAAAAASRRFGPRPLWDFVAGASGGLLLANTSCPLPL